MYLFEWGRRAVRDPRYFAIEPKLTLTVERIRAQEEKRWIDFQERSQKFQWEASKTAQEAKILQQRLDRELNRELERTLGLDLDLGLGR
jgi:hypothetical protein